MFMHMHLIFLFELNNLFLVSARIFLNLLSKIDFLLELVAGLACQVIFLESVFVFNINALFLQKNSFNKKYRFKIILDIEIGKSCVCLNFDA